jgi:uncharacterized membrane protein
MTRFYHILLFFLAPFCVIGAEVIVELVSKRRIKLGTSILLLIVLVPYFLFQTSFVYELTGSQSCSVPLSMYRMDKLQLFGSNAYVDEQSVCGVEWLLRNVNTKQVPIYSDGLSRFFVLTSYGNIYYNDIREISNTTSIAPGGVLYMSRLNIAYGKVVTSIIWNSSEFSALLGDLSKVYTNGGCELYVSGS